MIEDLALTTKALHQPQLAGRLSYSARRGLGFVMLLVLFGVIWESLKRVFSISDQKLPHLAAIFGEFGTRTRGGSGPILGGGHAAKRPGYDW